MGTSCCGGNKGNVRGETNLRGLGKGGEELKPVELEKQR